MLRGVGICLLIGLSSLTVGAGAASAAPSTPTQVAPDPVGSIGLRLLDAPVSAGDDPRARLYIVDHLAPGATIERRVEVSNTTDGTAHVELYAAAATIDDGTFLGADGREANELSTATTVDPAASEIASEASTVATVTITVPNDAAPGEQYGVVWAETRSAPASGGVTQVSRVGIRLYLSVGPGGAPASAFTIDSLAAGRAEDGHPIVLASVHNTGGRALDIGGTLNLRDGPGALNAGPFDADLGTTVAIGATAAVSIDLDPQLPAGPWEAIIELHSGLLDQSATATITFPEAGVAAPSATATPTPWWRTLLPWAGAFVVAIGALVLIHQRRAPRVRARSDQVSRDRVAAEP